jgi:hypothetical protein
LHAQYRQQLLDSRDTTGRAVADSDGARLRFYHATTLAKQSNDLPKSAPARSQRESNTREALVQRHLSNLMRKRIESIERAREESQNLSARSLSATSPENTSHDHAQTLTQQGDSYRALSQQRIDALPGQVSSHHVRISERDPATRLQTMERERDAAPWECNQVVGITQQMSTPASIVEPHNMGPLRRLITMMFGPRRIQHHPNVNDAKRELNTILTKNAKPKID